VGQLQHRGVIPYSFHRDLLDKVRSLIVSSTPTDGFGKA
jgi:HTH-type transcriptional regulator/antitoxin HigA